jgi:hypothetical protein
MVKKVTGKKAEGKKGEKPKRQLLPLYGRRMIRTQLIEILIPPNFGAPKTTLPFPDIPNLRNTYLYHIKAYSSGDIPKSILSGNTLIDDQVARSLFVSLQGYNGKLFVSQKPLITLKTSNTTRIGAGADSDYNYEVQPVNFTGQKVNWSKSYIELADPGLIGIENSLSVLFKIYYSGFPAFEKKARAASFKNRK